MYSAVVRQAAQAWLACMGIQVPSGRIEYWDRGRRWRQSIDGLNIDPNSFFLRWCLDHLRRPPELHSVAANEPAKSTPSSPAARTVTRISCSFTETLHFPDSPWTYLTFVLDTLWWILLKCPLFPRSTAFTACGFGSWNVLWVACSERLYHHANNVTLHL